MVWSGFLRLVCFWDVSGALVVVVDGVRGTKNKKILKLIENWVKKNYYDLPVLRRFGKISPSRTCGTAALDGFGLSLPFRIGTAGLSLGTSLLPSNIWFLSSKGNQLGWPCIWGLHGTTHESSPLLRSTVQASAWWYRNRRLCETFSSCTWRPRWCFCYACVWQQRLPSLSDQDRVQLLWWFASC